MRWIARVLAGIVPLWLVVLAFPAFSAEPAASDWVAGEAGRVRLIAAADSLASGQSETRLALEFDLAPGWKIYWRTPGDAGYPPRIDWNGSDNLAGAVLRWPAPHRFLLGGLQNYGYQGHVALPMRATRSDPARPLTLRGRVDFLACATLCVPQQAELELRLPTGSGGESAFAPTIAAAEAAVPGSGAAVGLSLERIEARGQGATARLRLIVRADPPFTDPDLFVESETIPAFATPELTLSADRRRLQVEIVPTEPVTGTLVGQKLTVTLTDGARALETVVSPEAAPAGAAEGEPSLPVMLLVALLGGLVLNLMPCVLPVLSIKLLGILGHGGGERGAARRDFLASAAGILASFLALAGLAVGLRAAGLAVGWGIQFQQPIFLMVMIGLLLAFAANLWGWYEIALPRWLLDRLPTGPARGGLTAPFLAGAFATLLATPCSAPFVGTAIAFALGRGPAEILAIFTALGLGMAVPFLLVAAWPEAVLRLPRPGRWMVRLRVVLGCALAGTALWLGLVLSNGVRDHTPSTAGAVPWVRFDPTAIAAQVAAGKVVLVDITADWCLTCKVNAAAVLERDPVARRLAAPDVVAMQGDWTRPDPAITDYLARFNRYGIPFTAVYGPALPAGEALPEVLTPALVEAALDRAR